MWPSRLKRHLLLITDVSICGDRNNFVTIKLPHKNMSPLRLASLHNSKELILLAEFKHEYFAHEYFLNAENYPRDDVETCRNTVSSTANRIKIESNQILIQKLSDSAVNSGWCKQYDACFVSEISWVPEFDSFKSSSNSSICITSTENYWKLNEYLRSPIRDHLCIIKLCFCWTIGWKRKHARCKNSIFWTFAPRSRIIEAFA